jgi:phage gp29-like protein
MINKPLQIANISQSMKLLPNPSQVLRSKQATMAIYHKVWEHPDIFAVSQNYKDAICAMKKSCSDTKINDYLIKYKSQIKKFTRDIISARDYGFCVIQILKYEQFQGLWVPSEFSLCPPEMFQIGIDGELRYMSREASPNGIDVMKTYPNKFIWVKNEDSLIKPYGLSLLDSAYWVAVGLNGNFDAMLNFAEYDGADKWVGYYAPNATEIQKQEMLTSLVRLKTNSASIMPEGARVELIQNAGRSSTASLYHDINEMLLRKIEKLWFGTDLMMQTEGKGGYSSSQSGIDLREDALQLGVDLLENGLNQLYQVICNINQIKTNTDINFTIESPRKISKEEAEVDKIYIDMGLVPTESFFLNRGYTKEEISSVQNSQISQNNKNQTSQFSEELDLSSIFDLYKDNLPK